MKWPAGINTSRMSSELVIVSGLAPRRSPAVQPAASTATQNSTAARNFGIVDGSHGALSTKKDYVTARLRSPNSRPKWQLGDRARSSVRANRCAACGSIRRGMLAESLLVDLSGLPVHHPAAVDVDRLTGHVLRSRRGQNKGHGGHVLGRLPTLQRDQLPHLVPGPVFIRALLGQRAADRPTIATRPG